MRETWECASLGRSRGGALSEGHFFFLGWTLPLVVSMELISVRMMMMMMIILDGVFMYGCV